MMLQNWNLLIVLFTQGLCVLADVSVNGGRIRVPLKRAASNTASTSNLSRRGPIAPLFNDRGSQYLAEIEIGTPSQKFTVAVDTGSADFWIPDHECPVLQCPLDRFDGRRSKTFESLNQSFSITYGIGSARGHFAIDQVRFGGLTADKQQFGLATATERILSTKRQGRSHDPQINGIFGLAFPRLTASDKSKGYTPFMFNLLKNHALKRPVFSIFLNSVDKAGWAGELLLGDIDPSKYEGDLAYLSVAQSTLFGESDYYYWSIYGQAVAVLEGVESPYVPFVKPLDIILDTGSTLTYMPAQLVSVVIDAVLGKGRYKYDDSTSLYYVDCGARVSDRATLELHFSANDSFSSAPYKMRVSAKDLVLPYDGSTIEKANTCIFGIAPIGVQTDRFIVGDSMLRSTYLVFDMQERRIGLAPARTDQRSGSSHSSNACAYSTKWTLYALIPIILMFL